MAQDLTGLKIRSLRKQVGLTQGELARRAGISASYLNLIELNKRVVAGLLLQRIAAGLGVDRTALDGATERRIIDVLDEVAADPSLAGDAHPGPTEELVSRHPGWANLVLRLYRAYLAKDQAVLALADRLNRDPFLGESVHRMLTNVTSIRSAAEILEGDDALGPDDRRRFLSIIGADSDKLSGAARGLISFFDQEQMRVRAVTPVEQVDAFVLEADNHFPELEAVAEAFLKARRAGETAEEAAERLLKAAPRAGSGPAAPLAAETRRFLLFKDLSVRIAGDTVRGIVEAHPALGSAEARAFATEALHAYVAGAILMPYEAFREAAAQWRYDVDVLGRLFGVSYEQVAHRLATLRRPGAEGVRFGFMRSDPSGYVTKRLPLPRLPFPRYGNTCPLLPIYGAFQSPGVTVRSFGELPSGEQFFFFARAVEKRGPSARFPRHLLSVMLACPARDASRVVHADGIDRAAATVPMGTICRLCPRPDCGHRQEPPLIA